MKPNQLIINGVNIQPAAFKIINPKKASTKNDLKLMLVQMSINFWKQLFCKHKSYVYNPYTNQLTCKNCNKNLKK